MDFNRFMRKKELIDLTTQLIQIPTENPPGNEKKTGFAKILVEREGKPLLIDNPKWRRG